MNDLPCEVVRDLLPSYVDGLTSEMTNRLVDAHVETCAPCRSVLDAMRAPEEKPGSAGSEKEIDYLKKNKRRNRAVVLWSLVGALTLALAVLLLRVFVVGEELYDSVVLYDVRVEGDKLSARTTCTDSARAITQVYYSYNEEDGVVTLRFKGVLASIFHANSDFNIFFSPTRPIRQVRVGERIYWDDGEEIGKTVSDLFQTRHDYVGDMSANARTAEAIGVYEMFGPYENELQTSERPYRWTITLQNDIPKNQRDYLEHDMRKTSCLMLALIANLDEVRFAYTVDGIPAHQTMTAESASELFGQNVKDCGKSAKLLQELMTSVPY